MNAVATKPTGGGHSRMIAPSCCHSGTVEVAVVARELGSWRVGRSACTADASRRMSACSAMCAAWVRATRWAAAMHRWEQRRWNRWWTVEPGAVDAAGGEHQSVQPDDTAVDFARHQLWRRARGRGGPGWRARPRRASTAGSARRVPVVQLGAPDRAFCARAIAPVLHDLAASAGRSCTIQVTTADRVVTVVVGSRGESRH